MVKQLLNICGGDQTAAAKLLQQLKSPKKKVTVDDSTVIIEMIVSSVGL